MALALEPATGQRFAPIPLEGLAGSRPLEFPVYLATGRDTWILYRDIGAIVDDEQLGRLKAEGIESLYVPETYRHAYFQRIENKLVVILNDRQTGLQERAEILHGVAEDVSRDLVSARLDKEGIDRARKVLFAGSGLLLREPASLRAVRQVLGASEDLAQHSLTVAFLCMGLARDALGSDPVHLVNAGLAGLLHELGRVGFEGEEHDTEHTSRGAQLLDHLNLPREIVEAVLYHHERWDGTGYPEGLRGEAIPKLARLVSVADVFEKVYSSQRPRLGVYDVLRIMAHAWKGCFDPDIVAAFVRIFA